jgi:signal transduction histidine kinase
MRILIAVLFALLASICTAQPLQQQPVLLQQMSHEDFSGRMAMLVDPQKSLTLADVSDSAYAHRFTPLPGNLNFGFSSAAIWLRFDMQRTPGSTHEWWLEVAPSIIDYVTLYVPNADGSYSARRSGDSLPFEQREIVYQNPVFKLDLPPDRQQTFYLRVAGKNPLSVRLTAWQPAAFAAAIANEHMLYGLLFGMHIAMVLASLWFWQATRDVTYAFFAGFTLASMSGIAAASGLLQQYLLPTVPYWHDPAIGISLVLGVAFGIQFVMQFAEVGRYFPRLVARFQVVLWLYCLFAAVAIALGYFKLFMPLFQISLLIFAFAILVLMLILSMHGQPRTRYVLAGLGLLCTAALVRMLQNFGYLPLSVLTENSYRISMLIYLLIMNYAMSRRYQDLRREKEAAQFALLTASRDAEHKLETLVALRTRDLQQAMQQVEHALVLERIVQKQQRQFLATVSHEIRTPLAVIDAAAQNLERELKSLQGAAAAVGWTRLERIQQAVLRLSSLFDQYADEAHFEGLSQGINLQWCALEPMLQDAADAARILADGHVFQIDPATLSMMICCDPDLMRLILRTLADNAVKYTPPGTRIVLTGETGANGWIVSVRDDGPGIALKEQERIFEKYFRGEAAARHAGTGLGLALGRRLAEMQGGTLSLISAPGQGSTFRIWLPHFSTLCDVECQPPRPPGLQSSADAGPKNS